jgi:hypothetical protein
MIHYDRGRPESAAVQAHIQGAAAGKRQRRGWLRRLNALRTDAGRIIAATRNGKRKPTDAEAARMTGIITEWQAMGGPE